MNRALLCPYKAYDLPRTIQHFLRDDPSSCIAFNRHGNLLAVGTRLGRIVLWDFDTRTVATSFPSTPPRHTDNPILSKSFNVLDGPSIISISFPAPGNASAVLVAYRFGLIQIYHTLSAQLLCEVQFDLTLHQAVAHPKLESVAIVTPEDGVPIVLRLCMGRYQCPASSFSNITTPDYIVSLKPVSPNIEISTIPPTPPTAYANTRIASLPSGDQPARASLLCAQDDFNHDGHIIELTSAPTSSKRSPNFTIVFTRREQLVLRGGPTGKICTFRLPSDDHDSVKYAQCIATAINQGKACIREIIVSRREMVLVNSHDRCMRLYNLSDICSDDVAIYEGDGKTVSVTHNLTALATFTEVVNRSQCRTACFSIDGDYILGGIEGTQHRMHVWRVHDGQIEISLEGPKEGVVQMLMHPLRPVIVSLGHSTGGVYIWAHEVHENWSAFSTQFTELEANEEYVEREDEFDLVENGHSAQRSCAGNEDADVDITSDYRKGWFSSDSEDDAYFYVPAIPQPDEIRQSIPSLATQLISDRVAEMQKEAAYPNGTSTEDDNTTVRSEGIQGGGGGEARKRRRWKSSERSTAKRSRASRISVSTTTGNVQEEDSKDVEVVATSSAVEASQTTKSPSRQDANDGTPHTATPQPTTQPDAPPKTSDENGRMIEEQILEVGNGDVSGDDEESVGSEDDDNDDNKRGLEDQNCENENDNVGKAEGGENHDGGENRESGENHEGGRVGEVDNDVEDKGEGLGGGVSNSS